MRPTFVVLAAVLALAVADTRDVHVDAVNGNDANSGGTAAAALRTSAAARDAVRTLRATGFGGAVSVLMHPGAYEHATPLALDTRDGGASAAGNTTWRAAHPNANPARLLGGVTLNLTWERASAAAGAVSADTIWRAALPASLRTQLADVDGGQIPSLFVDGTCNSTSFYSFGAISGGTSELCVTPPRRVMRSDSCPCSLHAWWCLQSDLIPNPRHQVYACGARAGRTPTRRGRRSGAADTRPRRTASAACRAPSNRRRSRCAAGPTRTSTAPAPSRWRAATRRNPRPGSAFQPLRSPHAPRAGTCLRTRLSGPIFTICTALSWVGVGIHR